NTSPQQATIRPYKSGRLHRTRNNTCVPHSPCATTITSHVISKEPPKEHTMQFDLKEEQKEIRDIVQRFTEQEITPHAEMWDETNYFPREIYHKMAALGLMGMTTLEEYGGSDLSRLSNTLVYEELA